MRLAIVTAAIFCLAAGTSFAQNQPQPSELGAAPPPPVASEPAAAPRTAAPQLPDASKVLTEQQAKAKIESEGYTEVSGLKKDAKGMWTATAMKEGKPFQISLDTEGHIAVLN